MSSLNKAMIIGNLGRDPEIRHSQSGTTIANLAIATSRKVKDQQSGEYTTYTEWHRVSFFGRKAEVVEKYLRKGSKVYVEGRLQTRKWQADDGSDRYSTEIVANEMQMLDSRNSGNGNAGQQQSQPQSQAQGQASQQADDDFYEGDEIPF